MSVIISPEHFTSCSKAQQFLDNKRGVISLFNNGIYLIDANMNIVAEAPHFQRKEGRVEAIIPFLTSTARIGLPDISEP
ncbi:hypothetical protein FDZ71_18415, partial [bacterium]